MCMYVHVFVSKSEPLYLITTIPELSFVDDTFNALNDGDKLAGPALYQLTKNVESKLLFVCGSVLRRSV